MKKIAAKLFAYWVDRKNQKWINNPLEAQQKNLSFWCLALKTQPLARITFL